MPNLTTKLGLKKPLGNETVSRASYNENLDLIDTNAASQAQADQPFYLKSATYDAVGNKIDLTFGPGRAVFLGTLVAKTADSTYSISAPTINTTYYVYLKSDGTYTNNTTGAEIAGAVQIWAVATGATIDVITKTDRRGQLPGASGSTSIKARVYRGAAQSIPNQTVTLLTFDSEDYDTDGIHDLAVNPERLTCKTPGLYLLTAHVAWATNATGFREVAIQVNTQTVAVLNISASSVGTYMSVPAVWPMNVGDYAMVAVNQNSGGALDVIRAGRYSPEFTMTRIGP